MLKSTNVFQFTPDGVTFRSADAAKWRQVYLPLSGPSPYGIKSVITPFLGGDIKTDKNTYVTKPVSREDLRQGLREFFVFIDKKGIFGLSADSAPDSAYVEIGLLWHRLVRRHPAVGLEIEALNFVPVADDSVELMRVTVRNISRKVIKFTPTAAVPLFGRALANKHDHEHVTSLLHRIRQTADGVLVAPTMLFNEEGHKAIERVFFVWGRGGKGEAPTGTFPTFDSFYSEQGTFACPAAVRENQDPWKLTDSELQGKEAVGALRFKAETLKPGAAREYLLIIGTAPDEKSAKRLLRRFGTVPAFDSALKDNMIYWRGVTRAIEFSSNERAYDTWMKWVMLQPTLRRLWGCSFLPDHDYGKGGKGWRDLWQDLLALILSEPEMIRGDLINNFLGVRIDGSNATIIGSRHGEFLADRNAITRVWMDHGVWPLLTTMLYIHQTGDTNVLFEEVCYFRDAQFSRARDKDLAWRPEHGIELKTIAGGIYLGTVLEHLLLQNLVQFFNVGEHNLIRLENADWNDGLDMAAPRGESVAFSAMYAGNLLSLADLLDHLAKGGDQGDGFLLAKEMLCLLDTLSPERCDYGSAAAKRQRLYDAYFKSVQPAVSGVRVKVGYEAAAADLRTKAQWLFEKIRTEELVSVSDEKKTFQWFNGYYDNAGRRVEGEVDGRVRMTLTGQVFPVMSGLSDPAETREVLASVQHFLKDPDLGGIHLNTDFGVRNYLDLGRAFSFAYGTKENGAFFSHMTVMFGYALYKAGFASEGYQVLRTIFQMSQDVERARIYPGIPEYFDGLGRGMYPYLTGSASWLVYTELTQVYGIRGEYGDLIINPKLLARQFSSVGLAGAECRFAGKDLVVIYVLKDRLDYGKYKIKDVLINERPVGFEYQSPRRVRISRKDILTARGPVHVKVVLAG